MKNQQTGKKIQKTLVQKNGIPIMRLHRHGGCESLHTNSRSVEEKNPEIQGLTLKEESVIYATSRR